MSKKSNLSVRENKLVLEAQTNLLVAEVKEHGLRPDDLFEGIFGKTMDFFSGGAYSSMGKQADAMKKGSKGKYAMAAADAISRTKELPAALTKVKDKADEGLKVTKDALDTITDEETKKFLQDSIQKSASRIAAAQENELNRIAKAVVKRIDAANADEGGDNAIDDDTKKAYVGLIVQAAMLGALVTNLK